MTFEERIWNHIVRVHSQKITLSVDALEQSLAQENQASDRQSIVAFLKRCGQRRVGRFFAGRRGKPSRISWTRAPELMSDAEVIGHSSSGAAQSMARLVSQELPIRPGVVAKLVVPENLTSGEADRLAEFIKRLPLAV